MFSRLLCTHITDFPGVPVFYHRHLTVEILDFDLGTAWDTVPRFQVKEKVVLSLPEAILRRLETSLDKVLA